MSFSNVYIVGFGQIGKSIANTLKINSFPGKIFISSRKQIDDYSIIDGVFNIKDLHVNYNNSVVFVCTPPDTTESILKQMFEITKNVKDNIVTDVCSVKKQVAKFKIHNFISTHPMDGGNSDKKIKLYFKKNILNYVLNDNINDSNRVLCNELLNFYSNFLNCKNELVSAILHDKIVAFTSHLQNLILASYYCNFAKINTQMWKEIFIQNTENIEYFFNFFLQKLQVYINNHMPLEMAIYRVNMDILEAQNIKIKSELFNTSLTKVFELKDNVVNLNNKVSYKTFIENMNNFFNRLVIR